MIVGYFQGIRSYLGVEWPVVLGFLAFQEESKRQQKRSDQLRRPVRSLQSASAGTILYLRVQYHTILYQIRI